MSDGRTGYGFLYRIGLRPWEFDDGGLFLLYALEPGRLRGVLGAPRGVTRAGAERLFRDDFDLLDVRPAARGPFEPVTYRMRRSVSERRGPGPSARRSSTSPA